MSQSARDESYGTDWQPRVPLKHIGFRDLDLERAPVRCYSSRGTPFVRWEPLGMPRIPRKVLDCVCYLYDDEDAARAGRNFGGTGFLVSMPSERFPAHGNYVYAVTNWHVACQGTSVLRINTKDGGTDIIPFGPDEWEFDPVSGYDLAVVPLPLNRDLHRYSLIPTEIFVKRDDLDEIGMTGLGTG